MIRSAPSVSESADAVSQYPTQLSLVARCSGEMTRNGLRRSIVAQGCEFARPARARSLPPRPTLVCQSRMNSLKLRAMDCGTLSVMECLLLALEHVKRIVANFIDHYNPARLHSATGYITPADRLADRHRAIFAARDKKLESAREQR
jgi:transposase InsO family protein